MPQSRIVHSAGALAHALRDRAAAVPALGRRQADADRGRDDQGAGRCSASSAARCTLPGFENIPIDEVIREGLKSDEIMKAIDGGRGRLHSRAWRGHPPAWARAAGFVAGLRHDHASRSPSRWSPEISPFDEIIALA